MAEDAPATAAAGSPAPSEGPARLPAAPPRRSTRKIILPLVGFAVLIAGLAYGVEYVRVGRFLISTDDAYVRGNLTNVVSKVQGYVTAVLPDNSVVKAGDTIASLDAGDYKLALDAALTHANTQRATLDRIATQVKQQDAQIDQAKAGIVAAQADLTRTTLDADRYSKLAQDRYASSQTYETAIAARDRARASVDTARAQLASAEAGRAVLIAQKAEAERTLAELEVQVAKARRDLEFTEIKAPVDGTFGNRSLEVGGWAQPGIRIGALIATNSLYVEANFKETQLTSVRPGMAATISVDALGGREYRGTVESFAPASGSVFSVLPPENATGNFTKIVQRVPIRVSLPPEAQREALIKPGVSVTITIDTRSSGTPPGDSGAAVAASITPASSKP